MAWSIEFDDEFKKEYDQFNTLVKEELVARALTLGEVGSQSFRQTKKEGKSWEFQFKKYWPSFQKTGRKK